MSFNFFNEKFDTLFGSKKKYVLGISLKKLREPSYLNKITKQQRRGYTRIRFPGNYAIFV